MENLDKFERITIKQIWDFITKYKWVFLLVIGLSGFIGRWVNERFLFMYKSEQFQRENMEKLEKIVTDQNTLQSTSRSFIEYQIENNEKKINNLEQRFNHYIDK